MTNPTEHIMRTKRKKPRDADPMTRLDLRLRTRLLLRLLECPVRVTTLARGAEGRMEVRAMLKALKAEGLAERRHAGGNRWPWGLTAEGAREAGRSFREMRLCPKSRAGVLSVRRLASSSRSSVSPRRP